MPKDEGKTSHAQYAKNLKKRYPRVEVKCVGGPLHDTKLKCFTTDLVVIFPEEGILQGKGPQVYTLMPPVDAAKGKLARLVHDQRASEAVASGADRDEVVAMIERNGTLDITRSFYRATEETT